MKSKWIKRNRTRTTEAKTETDKGHDQKGHRTEREGGEEIQKAILRKRHAGKEMKHAARDGKIDRNRKMYKERVAKNRQQKTYGEKHVQRQTRQTGKGINREINHRELTAK